MSKASITLPASPLDVLPLLPAPSADRRAFLAGFAAGALLAAAEAGVLAAVILAIVLRLHGLPT